MRRSGPPDPRLVWSCRDCDWKGLKHGQHEQETVAAAYPYGHWTVCPPPTRPAED